MTKNLARFCHVSLMVLLASFLTGCNHKSGEGSGSNAPEPVAPAKATAQIEAAFQPAADVTIKGEAKAAAVALKSDQLDVAYGELQKLKYSNKLTPQQDMAVRNAIIGVSEKIARGVAAGDPKAIEMSKRMQRTQ